MYSWSQIKYLKKCISSNLPIFYYSNIEMSKCTLNLAIHADVIWIKIWWFAKKCAIQEIVFARLSNIASTLMRPISKFFMGIWTSKYLFVLCKSQTKNFNYFLKKPILISKDLRIRHSCICNYKPHNDPYKKIDFGYRLFLQKI